jgi:hypothetical protein
MSNPGSEALWGSLSSVCTAHSEYEAWHTQWVVDLLHVGYLGLAGASRRIMPTASPSTFAPLPRSNAIADRATIKLSGAIMSGLVSGILGRLVLPVIGLARSFFR